MSGRRIGGGPVDHAAQLRWALGQRYRLRGGDLFAQPPKEPGGAGASACPLGWPGYFTAALSAAAGAVAVPWRWFMTSLIASPSFCLADSILLGSRVQLTQSGPTEREICNARSLLPRSFSIWM